MSTAKARSTAIHPSTGRYSPWYRLHRQHQAPVLVNGKPIRYRTLQQALWSAGLAILLGLVVAGWYFGGTQVDWYVHVGPVYFHIFDNKIAWDDTTGRWLSQHVWFITQQNWHDYRHYVARNLLEPTVAILGVMSLLAPRKYWKERVGPARMALTLVLFLVVYVVLACAGTWLILWGLTQWNPPGFSHGLWVVAQVVILGFVIGRVERVLFGPVGAYFQGIWVERGVDNHLRHGRPGVPLWVRLPLPPTIRERGQEQVDEDRMPPVTGGLSEADRLAREGVTRRSRAVYWLLGLGVPLLVGLAFLGTVGHVLVGILGYSFPYLAP